MGETAHLISTMANNELACVYAALILADDDVAVTPEKITTILKAAGVEVEPYWPGLFSKALESSDIKKYYQRRLRSRCCSRCWRSRCSCCSCRCGSRGQEGREEGGKRGCVRRRHGIRSFRLECIVFRHFVARHPLS